MSSIFNSIFKHDHYDSSCYSMKRRRLNSSCESVKIERKKRERDRDMSDHVLPAQIMYFIKYRFSRLLIKVHARGKKSRWHRFSPLVMERGRDIFSPSSLPIQQARRYIFRAEPQLVASPHLHLLSLSLPFGSIRPQFSYYLYPIAQKDYFRLVSKVNIASDGLALVHLLLTMPTKVVRH